MNLHTRRVNLDLNLFQNNEFISRVRINPCFQNNHTIMTQTVFINHPVLSIFLLIASSSWFNHLLKRAAWFFKRWKLFPLTRLHHHSNSQSFQFISMCCQCSHMVSSWAKSTEITKRYKKVPKVTFAEFSMGFDNMNYQIGSSWNLQKLLRTNLDPLDNEIISALSLHHPYWLS